MWDATSSPTPTPFTTTSTQRATPSRLHAGRIQHGTGSRRWRRTARVLGTAPRSFRRSSNWFASTPPLRQRRSCDGDSAIRAPPLTRSSVTATRNPRGCSMRRRSRRRAETWTTTRGTTSGWSERETITRATPTDSRRSSRSPRPCQAARRKPPTYGSSIDRKARCRSPTQRSRTQFRRPVLSGGSTGQPRRDRGDLSRAAATRGAGYPTKRRRMARRLVT